MTGDQAVVLCRTEAGLRAAAWLAHHGVQVRLLCTGPFPRDLGAPLAYRGPRDVLGTVLGQLIDVSPHTALWIGPNPVPAPRRKRDLLAAVGETGAGAWGRYLTGRALRPSDTAMEWVSRWLGEAVWSEALGPWLSKRLGGPSARVPPGVAWRLFGQGDEQGWWAPGTDGAGRTSAWVDGIIEAGGEALEEVTVEALEVEHGRVTAVLTEFGRELVHGPLITDLLPGELAGLLPEGTLDRAELGSWPTADRVQVELKVEAAPRPWLTWVGADRSPLVAVRRAWGSAGEPRPDRIVAELVVAPGDRWYGATEEQLGELAGVLVEGLASPRGAPLRIRREAQVVCRAVPRSEAQWDDLARSYQSLGLLPVGETGLGLPVDLIDELRHLGAAREGAMVPTLRRQLLQHGPPQEPWLPVSRA